MQCFKRKKRKIFNNSSNEKTIINDLLQKYDKDTIKINDSRTLGELLFDLILTRPSPSSSSSSSSSSTRNKIKLNDEQINYAFIKSILSTKLVNINEIKNFLNQTLLHIATENNDFELCKFLVFECNASCLLEDNYRLTPLIMASKRNYFDLLKMFVDSLQMPHNTRNQIYNLVKLQQIRKASYYACCAGHLNVVDYLFKMFNLNSEQLQYDNYANNNEIIMNGDHKEMKTKLELNNFNELNCLHVACYKAHYDIVAYLVENSVDPSAYINKPINIYRDSTPLEEAFKGLLTIHIESEEENCVNRKRNCSIEYDLNKKELNYKAIINYLIENGASFSTKFLLNNGFAKIATQMYFGENKDVNFIHYLTCLQFICNYKLCELLKFDSFDTNTYCKLYKITSNNNDFDANNDNDAKPFEIIQPDDDDNNKTNTQTTIALSHKNSIYHKIELIIDDLLYVIYSIILKVIKDYKNQCLCQYYELIQRLYQTNQLTINRHSKFLYLKERNYELYEKIMQLANRPKCLKSLCYATIRNCIKNFGYKKACELHIPNSLKYNLFYSINSNNNNNT